MCQSMNSAETLPVFIGVERISLYINVSCLVYVLHIIQRLQNCGRADEISTDKHTRVCKRQTVNIFPISSISHSSGVQPGASHQGSSPAIN